MRRRRFGENNGQKPDEWSDFSKYEEKYIMPTDAVAAPEQGGFAAPQNLFTPPPQSAGYGSVGQTDGYGASPQNGYSAQGVAGGNGASAVTTTTERPMVFALRAFKNVYVYEYSDRLEYWTLNDMGVMTLSNTEYKKQK